MEIVEKLIFILLAGGFIYTYFKKQAKGKSPTVAANTVSTDYSSIPEYLWYNVPGNLPPTGPSPDMSAGFLSDYNSDASVWGDSGGVYL